MTKRLNSKHKVDRRLRVNLWGRPKSPFNTRAYPPGQHGQTKSSKPSDFGIQPGDRVAALMANVPETIVWFLATASLGAVWSSCSPDFGAAGVVDRFGQIEPRILVCNDEYFYNGKRHNCGSKIIEIVSHIPSIETCVIVPYFQKFRIFSRNFRNFHGQLRMSRDFLSLTWIAPGLNHTRLKASQQQ